MMEEKRGKSETVKKGGELTRKSDWDKSDGKGTEVWTDQKEKE